MSLVLASVGTDPEVFVTRNGEIIPCVDIIPGDKGNAIQISEHIGLLEDNVCLEWNLTPSYSKEEFVHKNVESLKFIKEFIKDFNLGVEIKSMHKFKEDDLLHPKLMEFGCAPDFNAYTLKANQPPNAETPYRAAGGHLHFGIPNLDRDSIPQLVRIYDGLIGTFCVMNEEYSERRTMYGSAGAFRAKDYGFEYRTPSNFWVENKSHMESLYDLAEMSLSLFNDGVRIDNEEGGRVREIINSHDQEAARVFHGKFVKQYFDIKKKDEQKKIEYTLL